MGTLVLFTFILWLLWAYSRDGKERGSISSALWFVVLWAGIYGSRPVTEWFREANISTAASYDEGNLTEALISLSLILAGLVVLLSRGVRLSVIIRDNVWLCAFYLFWLMSILWSDYPVITLKRLFKDLGNVVMVLVVLTEVDSGEGIKAVFTRIAYLCIPLSIIFIRYFPDLGRVFSGYDLSNWMWVGVATHKNTLGALALMGALFLLWDFLDPRGKSRNTMKRGNVFARGPVLLMCWYLLVIVNSVTSLICAMLGSALLIAFSVPAIRRRPGLLEVWGLSAVGILSLLDLAFNLKEALLLSLGRDMTLTTRTDIWPILMNSQDSPLLGAGFNTFWAGERLKLMSDKVGGIIQAHNGYLEIYLQGGLIGVGLLVALLLSAYWRIRKQLLLGMSDSGIRYVVLLIAIFYNFSEASFNKVGILWFMTVFALVQYRVRPTHR